MKKEQPNGMPQQCIDTGEALVQAYGYDNAIKNIEDNVKTLRTVHDIMKEHAPEQIEERLKIALMSDFWDQTLQSLEVPKTLPRSFMAGLNPNG